MNRPLLFINVLLWVYVLVDVGTILKNELAPPAWYPPALTKAALPVCDTCSKPPVFLILLDEYMGSAAQLSYFKHNNQLFDDSLQQEGFHLLKQTRSNYPYTIYSMSSVLGMDYLDIDNIHGRNRDAYKLAVGNIKSNAVCNYFSNLGYSINNYSPFDLKQKARGYTTFLLANDLNLLSSETMWSRLEPDLLNRIAHMGLMHSWVRKIEDDYFNVNEKMMNRVLDDAVHKGSQPGFHYVHLMMPHNPYLTDSTGRRTVPYALRKGITLEEADQDYLQYLIYTNKRIMRFIRTLKEHTNGKAAILLMSDHGFRGAIRKSRELVYHNLNAVYLPDGNYAGWYDGMTNVNQFRVLFNTLFHQQMPMLKDSLVP
ncbi:sulfatase-like hydrolase/transferase [Paraflavitalea speifideaquila]|uniref:sulfatase-like hydrolase/transferase n=1 Tax=Paraflavitalea speifideaquila TaxID=3076558 RepID=UPI0028ED2B46|nr:sulfatase-like hydrolase/transferase [Paraflavitalea speifideiaquila]